VKAVWLNRKSAFGQAIFDVSVTMTEVEAAVQPNCIADDVRRESVKLVCIHPPILSRWLTLFANTTRSTL
jgi:hypothetical protein